MRGELLNGEIFCTLKEALVLIESWRRHYNAVRPHSSLGYRPPAPENNHRAKMVARLRYAPPVTQLGRKTINVLTFKPDHSVGPVKPNAKSIPYVVTVLKQPCSI